MMKRELGTAEIMTSVKERGKWATKTEYILVVVGNLVGLGNVWRFPYLCYKNGGGAFLLPYCLLAAVVGIPLFLLETAMGQYTQEGFLTCWDKLCPLAKGIGYGQLGMKFYELSYFVIQAWTVFYLVFSFTPQLPWTSCNNTWNTVNCIIVSSTNVTVNQTGSNETTSASVQFWEKRVLGMSSGIEELGSVRWDLALALLFCWVTCYFSIWKGIKSSGKVVYFTATFPYLMLLILLIRGVTLPGAWDGIYYYLFPDFKRLANLEVWVEAGSQICFSYSLSSGILHVMSSHNEYTNNCYKDCFWLCLLNSGTSFLAGFVIFSLLGFMAHKQGVTVDKVAESGPGLAFIVYPEAAAMMPLPQLWSVCFFLMLFFLCVDTYFATVDSLITSLCDLFPKHLRRPKRREVFLLLVCLLYFLFQLILVTEGGIYIFQLIDYYACTRVYHYFMVLSETLALAWCFGTDRIIYIIEDMTGHRPAVYFQVCWKYILPVLSLTSFILYLVGYTHLKVNNSYVYPDWAYLLVWTMTLSCIICVPLGAAGQMWKTPGTFVQRWNILRRPAADPVGRRRETGEERTTVELMMNNVTA